MAGNTKKTKEEYNAYFANVLSRANDSAREAMDILPAETEKESRGYLICGGNEQSFYFNINGDAGPIKKHLAEQLGHDEFLLILFKSIIRNAEDILKDYKSQFTEEEWEDLE